MRVVLQRVCQASVEIDQAIAAEIGNGLLILLGIEASDNQSDIDWLTRKITQLRIFSDQHHRMNRSLEDINGSILIVSQFTLYANTQKGNRPSFIQAADPSIAIPLYEGFCQRMRERLEHSRVKTGVFGADMKINLCNDGPVTLVIDSRNKQ